jgi:phospholipid N-methyltransferase
VLRIAPIAIEGKIEHECHLKPKITDEYRRMMRKRSEETNKSKRSIQVVDSVQNGIHIGAIPHATESELINKVFDDDLHIVIRFIFIREKSLPRWTSVESAYQRQNCSTCCLLPMRNLPIGH